MSNKRDAMRRKKEQRRKKRRDKNLKHTKPPEEPVEENNKDDEAPFTSSDEYEDHAVDLVEKETAKAQVYATLALMATIRESVGLLLDVIAPEDDEDDEDE